MADPVVQPVAPSAAAGAAAPAAAAAVVAPAPVPPVESGAPAPAAPAVDAAAPKPEVAATLLEKFDAEAAAKAAPKPAEPVDVKPAEKPAVVDAKAVEKPAEKPDVKPAEAAKPGEAAKPAEAPKVDPAKPAPAFTAGLEPIKFEAVKLPDVLKDTKPDDKTFGGFLELVNNPAVSKPELVQGLVDMHGKAMQEYATKLLTAQYETFNGTTAEWGKKVMADPEIGGAGYQTSMGAIARVRDQFVSSAPIDSPKYKADRAEFEQFLRITGGGSHPALLRMLHNVAQWFDEPHVQSEPGKPTKDNGAAPGRRGRIMYDHPRSPSRAQ